MFGGLDVIVGCGLIGHGGREIDSRDAEWLVRVEVRDMFPTLSLFHSVRLGWFLPLCILIT